MEQDHMWCALYVKNGSETGAEELVSGLFSEKNNVRCVHLVRDRRKKYGGKWVTVEEKLFPGYVFLETDRPEAVQKELRKLPGRKLLLGGGAHVSALKESEAGFMGRIADRQGRIGISEVEIAQGGKIRYLSGPLAQLGHMVRKVDLHRRTAQIETDFLGEKHVLYLGIEIAGAGRGEERPE